MKQSYFLLALILYPLINNQASPGYGYYQPKPDFGRISRLMIQEIDALLEPFKQTAAVRFRLQEHKEKQVVLAIQALKRDAEYLSVDQIERKGIDFARSITYEFIKKETQTLIDLEFQYLKTPYSIRGQIIIMINDEIEADVFAHLNSNQRLTKLLQQLPDMIAKRVSQLTNILS